MTNQFKAGDVVWVKGEVTMIAPNGKPQIKFKTDDDVHCIQEFHAVPDKVHPAPQPDYPAEVTDDMVDTATRSIHGIGWKSREPYYKAQVRAALKKVLKAAPCQECQSKDVSDRQEVDRELLFKAIQWANRWYEWPSEYDPDDKDKPVNDFLATLKDKTEPTINLDDWELPFFALNADHRLVQVIRKTGSFFETQVANEKEWRDYRADGVKRWGPGPEIIQIHLTAQRKEVV